MLEDLSAHVLDIAENSVRAGGTEVSVTIVESVAHNILSFAIKDNGKGMTEEFAAKVTDPFTTTRTTRRVGMGLPFLKQISELCGGGLEIRTKVGVGTETKATFCYDSIDRPPMGDMPMTVMTLVAGSPEIHWIYSHTTDSGEFRLDTDEIIEALDGDRELLRTADVGIWLREHVGEGLAEIGAGSAS